MNIKEKRVELIELFYDLIYVYAISRLTIFIEEPKEGVLTIHSFFQYLLVCFIILQAWLYLTNYVNRYGRWRWYEYAITTVNIIATIFMINTINSDWNEMAAVFNVSMLVMLLCVAFLYLIQIILKEQDEKAAKNALIILSIDIFLYFFAFLAAIFHVGERVLLIDAVAVLTGAFLPFFVKGRFDISIISFPHLVERFELITIILFGECIVGIADFFDTRSLSFIPVLVIIIIILLFGSYVIQIHYLCKHHRVDRALPLMFSHYFVVISIDLITVAFVFLREREISSLFVAGFMTAAMIMFFTAIYANKIYYYENISLKTKDVLCAIGSIILGAVIMFSGGDNIYVFLAGALVIVLGNFLMLFMKFCKKREEDIASIEDRDAA